MIVNGQHGLDSITLPIKTNRKFYPEIYPNIENPREYISEFLNSSANVLILMGPAGLGKSAFINEIVLTAKVPTQIVFDPVVMQTDQLYTNFINRTLGENGGLMIMEDSDTVLQDRVLENNVTMARLLNLSDGIVDTSGAKFIFSANLNNKEDVDSALMRPGRCFDVAEFKNLTKPQALAAAEAIGIELYLDKDEYTVAEIFNSTSNRKQAKTKVGFI
jgi:SpoVK/Ycf46/Vps4 family AAA+-type ATPase